jgi:hypothetical protein
MIGEGGKYDDLCEETRVRACADGAMVIVIGGEHGSGFSVAVSAYVLASGVLPQVLRDVANQIEGDVSELKSQGKG